MSALEKQEGGEHYKSMAIQPVQFIHANGLGYFEGNVVKYVARHRSKNGVEDLKKARHYLDLLIELEYGLKADPSKCQHDFRQTRRDINLDGKQVGVEIIETCVRCGLQEKEVRQP